MGRFDLPDPDTLRAREKLVLDHFHDEVRQEWDDVLATFPHPHYELIAMMTVHDGDAAVRRYYDDTRVAFPDQDHEIIAVRHSADAVIVEFWLIGTHLGPLNGIPPTGGRFRVRMTGYFLFDEAENLVCERVYFDRLTMFSQLLAAQDMRDPRTWWWLVRALRGLARMGSTPDPRLTDTTPPDLSH
ncbi:MULTISPECIES: ester cyclase [Catenuloplanes]|uniref:Ester cyclase n=1 Tax=Catenuloplanes niger TaxID=587534 RepID=A0AAE3ZZK2_9ACTN|nr:ester cyclase [Catenuloplanes niger]MDR7326828.1 putative ester cyclase [Catenuloplanes niger]